MKHEIICPYCHSKNATNRTICENCSRKLDLPPYDVPPQELPKPQSTTLKICTIVALIVLLCCLCYLFIYLTSYN